MHWNSARVLHRATCLVALLKARLIAASCHRASVRADHLATQRSRPSERYVVFLEKESKATGRKRRSKTSCAIRGMAACRMAQEGIKTWLHAHNRTEPTSVLHLSSGALCHPPDAAHSHACDTKSKKGTAHGPCTRGPLRTMPATKTDQREAINTGKHRNRTVRRYGCSHLQCRSAPVAYQGPSRMP